MDLYPFGLRQDSFVYACMQSTYKYLPRYDTVFARIAARVPEVQFLFLEHPTAEQGTAIFKERLEAAFASFGLDYTRHCVFSPRLSPAAYLSMHNHADAVLDSIGWSGGVSTLETLTYDLPVITLPTGLMRGRHSAAFLERMGLSYCIAPTQEDFVALAVTLATKKDFHAQVRRDIAIHKESLYRDAEAIKGLESFLCSVTLEKNVPTGDCRDTETAR